MLNGNVAIAKVDSGTFVTSYLLPKHRKLGVALWGAFFFFFQAEDGIRDVAVTGVQTCALPISGRLVHGRCQWERRGRFRRRWDSRARRSAGSTDGSDVVWRARHSLWWPTRRAGGSKFACSTERGGPHDRTLRQPRARRRDQGAVPSERSSDIPGVLRPRLPLRRVGGRAELGRPRWTGGHGRPFGSLPPSVPRRDPSGACGVAGRQRVRRRAPELLVGGEIGRAHV